MIRSEVVVGGVITPILVYSKLQYEKFLNGTGVFEIAIPGNGSDLFDLFDDSNVINFYKSGVLDFKGVITNCESLNDGLMVTGVDEGSYKYSKVEAPDQKWLSETTDTILGVLDGRVNDTSVGTVNTVTLPSFRSNVNQSCLVALSRLASWSGNDWYFDYSSGTSVNLVSHLGSVSSIGVWNENVDIKNVRRKKDFENIVDYVKVLGASDGDNQVNGQYPSGVIATGSSVKTIIDKSIISNSEAVERAEKEHVVLSNPRYSYKFKVLNPFISVSLGDVLTINSNSSNASMVDVRVTKLVYVVIDDSVSLSVEVRSTSEREASEDFLKAEKLLKASFKDANSMNQGQANYNSWGEGINAKNGAPARVVFEVNDSMKNLNNDLNITSFSVDYDVDPYRSGIGTASEDNVAPSVSGASTDLHKHNPADSGHTHSIDSQTSGSSSSNSGGGGSSTYSSTESVSSSSWTNVYSFTAPSLSNCSGGILVSVCFRPLIASSFVDVRIADTTFSWYYPSSTGSRSTFTAYSGESILPCAISFLIPSIVYSDSMQVQMKQTYSDSQNVEIKNVTWTAIGSHSHSVSAVSSTDSANASVDDNNRNPNLSGNAASHNHGISIGDDVDDSASLNSTQVSLYLDFWDGSSWVNKYSVLNTGKTLDTNVDLSNSGVYPDATGFWRVRIEPNSSSPDYVNGIVKIISSLSTD